MRRKQPNWEGTAETHIIRGSSFTELEESHFKQLSS